MSNTDVFLDVRNFPSNGTDGFKDTPTSNNATYSYRYTGGSDGQGNVVETADGVSGTISVILKSDPRYEIHGVAITGDIEDQLSWEPAANSKTSVVITDEDTSTGNGYYNVEVTDSEAGCTFYCDPQVTNVPK